MTQVENVKPSFKCSITITFIQKHSKIKIYLLQLKKMAQFEFEALALILLIFGIEGKEEMSNIITLSGTASIYLIESD